MEISPKIVPRFEMELLLAEVLQKPREYVLMHPEIYPMEHRERQTPQSGLSRGVKLTKSQNRRFERLVRRRKRHEPIAYILGHKEFYGLDFKVDKNTLIPRPETEMLVEEVIESVRSSKHPENLTVIDVGTGSGNIIISIAKNEDHSSVEKNREIRYFAVDISQKALRVARQNAKTHHVEKKIRFLRSDLLKELVRNTKYEIRNTNLIIAANLPYLSKKIYSATMPDVKRYEPASALVSGEQGLDHYARLLSQMGDLKVGGRRLTAIFEIGPEQKSPLRKLVLRYHPSSAMRFQKDLSGRWRLAIIDT